MEIINRVPGFKPGMKLSDIHGHVCIDLHNHNSGFTERIEADNVVTQALNQIMPLAAAVNEWSNFFPVASKALGGIMLFDGSLGNYSASDIDVSLPSTAHLMGFAGQDTNTEEAFQGSFNAGESEAITGGYKTVWDFATNQANGAIGAVARTHKDVSSGPGNPIFTRTIGNNYPYTFPFNCGLNDDYVYAYGNYSYEDIKIGTCPNDNLKVADSFPPAATFEVFSDVRSNLKPLRSRTADQSGFYLNIYLNTQTSKYVYSLYEVDCTDPTAPEENIGHWSRAFEGEGALTPGVYGFTENHAYMLNGTGNTLYKVALSNGDIVDTISLPVIDTDFSISSNLHGVMYLTGYGTGQALLYPDGTVKYFSTKSLTARNYAFKLNNIVYSHLGSVNRPTVSALPYLGTVANLGSPIVKTASQSMKVTYTLTDQ